VALSFIDCVNRRDVDGLARLMTEAHELRVFDEPPLSGRDANVEGWRGYVESFPEYVIHPHRLAVDRVVVAVLGHTTGSHLGLPDDEETRRTLIWLVEVDGDRVASWTLIEDTAEHRAVLGLDQAEP
jgi:ketosteroid isomerase-like protein